MRCLPQPFDMIDLRRVNRLVDDPELLVCFQLAQRFTAFVDDVVIDNEGGEHITSDQVASISVPEPVHKFV
ncbi:hypothetical protein KB20921_02850 [Edwardsiella ictaluri]|nr:hypothetical protein KH20906_02860 [Edwardsiella ictaluri]BEI01024.1 hypothetical protein KB20921_02850 [Edwardsiella ictaluri]BEI04498.1 hypothetical protein KH201010_02840 [Edwardsiella ictaluri]BEI07953.1 hypothetical protein STU22726_02840 [Edwardsiella ictaluri]BEI11433.1 hypothetical protein STU22816_02860 [Edwardsiella ictaluri]